MKFSIRDLLLVTVIMALAVGWGIDRSKRSGLGEENGRLKAELDETSSLLSEILDVPKSLAPPPESVREVGRFTSRPMTGMIKSGKPCLFKIQSPRRADGVG